jgi:glycosyltransferase 2 family protein
MKTTSKINISIAIVCTLIFLVIVLWSVDISKANEALRSAQWLYFVPMFALYGIGHLLRTFRLWTLMERQGGDFSQYFSINSIGFLGINVIPFRLGEFLRPHLFHEKLQIPWTRSLSALFLERLLDVGMLFLLLLGVGFGIELPETGILVQDINVLEVGQRGSGFILILGSIIGMTVVFSGERLYPFVQSLPKGQKILSLLMTVQKGLGTLFSNPIQAVSLIALSMLIWLCTIFAVQFALLAFANSGMPHSFMIAWTVWTIILAGMTAVPTPGFFGIYELSAYGALSIWMVEESLSKTFALLLHLGQFGFIVILGSYFLLQEGLSLFVLTNQSVSKRH